MIDYGNFSRSLKNPEYQYGNYRNLDTGVSEFLKESMAESAPRSFDVRYDPMWETPRRYLREELGIVEGSNSPEHILRLGQLQ